MNRFVINRRLFLAGSAAAFATACAPVRAPAPAISMPVDPAATATPDLVDLALHDPRLRLDIRYATTNNFMGRVLYPVARAMAQRPAADALRRVQDRAEAAGYGLLIHDAYRPWRITKMMWDETPPAQREFVADPATGSRHNRGCAIDLTLHQGGVAVPMPSPYDDFTDKAYRSYMGGTAEETANRARLEGWMAAEGFIPLPNEWWHFDWDGWRRYPVMDQPLA
jgi:D-alanyl-D-alanine dipeptidase